VRLTIGSRKHSPPGAKFYVEEQFIGVTPLTYSVTPDGPKSPIHYTLQKDGYVTASGFLNVRFSRGRVVGAIFTLGILAFLIEMKTVTPHQLELGLIPAIAVDPTRATNETTEEKINTLKRLRDAGEITPAEYERYKSKVLGGD
jgi:hypothetical protein